MVVYHLTKKSGTFRWNVNGKINFVSQTEIFSGKKHFFKGRPKCQTEFPSPKRAFHLLVLLVPDLLVLSFKKMSWKWNEHTPNGNFHSGFDTSRLLQLSTNRFFRVNGKQPMKISQ